MFNFFREIKRFFRVWYRQYKENRRLERVFKICAKDAVEYTNKFVKHNKNDCAPQNLEEVFYKSRGVEVKQMSVFEDEKTGKKTVVVDK